MSVQLTNDAVKRFDARQLKGMVDNHILVKVDDNYFVTRKGLSVFKDESMFVNDNTKGITIEHSKSQKPGTDTKSQSTSYTVSSGAITNAMGISENKELNDAFNGFIKGKEGITIDESGNITYTDVNVMNRALAEFAKAHQEEFLDPNAQAKLQFLEGTDEGFKTTLVEKGVITATDDNNIYNVNNREALVSAMPNETADPIYQNSKEKKSLPVQGVITQTNVVEEDILDTPQNLSDNRKARNQLRSQAEIEYAKFALDPNNDAAVKLYLADTKYAKEIAKAEKELMTFTLPDGRNRVNQDPAQMVTLYLESGHGEELVDVPVLDEQGKQVSQNGQYAYKQVNLEDAVNEYVNKLLNSTNEQDKNAIDAKIKELRTVDNKYVQGAEGARRSAATILAIESLGIKPQDLLRTLAVEKVMPNDLSSEDVKFFAQKQSKDYVKRKQAGQDIEQAKVNLSMDGIGKWGRRLVMASPEVFGTKVDNQHPAKNRNNCFTVNNVQYEFNPEAFQAVLLVACDPDNATDQHRELVGKLMQDTNMTLPEGRDFSKMMLPVIGNDGKKAFLPIHQIIGGKNNKVGNQELNRLRHLVEKTGDSVDPNPTNLYRGLYVLGNAALGGAVGAGLGALGGNMAKALGIASQTIPGQAWSTSDRSITWQASPYTTTDYIHENVMGVDVTTSITNNHPGETGSITVSGEKGMTDARNINNTTRPQAISQGILGATTGAITGLLGMGDIHAKGCNNDDVFALRRTREVVGDPEQKDVSLEVPQFVKVEQREGKIEGGSGSKACKLKVTHVNANLNRAETMEDMICKYYGVELNSNDYRAIFDYVQKFNELQKFGGMHYTQGNIVNLPDIVPIDNNKKINRKYDPENPDEHQDLKEQDIPLGGRGVRPEAAKKSEAYKLQGKGQYTHGK